MRKFIAITMTLLILSNAYLLYSNYSLKKDVLQEQTTSTPKKKNFMSMMIETEAGSGKYQVSSSNTWPTDGYVFNNELSKCEQGSKLSWDDTNKKVVMEGNVSDKCYVYFDKHVPTVSEYIISKYNGTQGENGLYYHDSNLTNGAGDNSYRYAGTSAAVNNYICLGSNEVTCPDDNLYRIIGVFGDNNHGVTEQQLVKVIKNTSIGDIAWNTTKSNDWASASLNTILNSTFITERLSVIEDKIAEVSWKVSGYGPGFATAKTVYTGEITNATKTHTAKIGLMYASDYGFATTQDYWTTNLSSYYKAAKNTDWLLLGSEEWILLPYSGHNACGWTIGSGGAASGNGYDVYVVTNTYAVRPSFYLTSDVQYSSGSGTSTDPIRIK